MKYFRTISFLVFAITFLSFLAFSQTGEPRQENLLNGLKLLTWTDAKAEKTTIKIRIHSGSVFDPKDKMGVMAMLSEILFPSEQTKEYFEQDLEGSIEVTNTYDYIQISATAKSDEFLTVLEVLATAITNPQITAENFTKIRNERLKYVQDLQKNPNYLADKVVSNRLLGDFPYGRPSEGTVDSLAKIDKVDLIFARDKFLTADNATIAIIGNKRPNLVAQAVKRYFGVWKKSDKLIPPTFATPAEPDTKPLIIESESEEFRLATRGIARNDKDFFPMRFLFASLKNSGFLNQNSFVKYERNMLPGIIILGNSGDAKSVQTFASSIISTETKQKLSADFANTRAKILSEIEQKPLIDKWLDVHTFRLVSVSDEIKKLNAVTFADVEKFADRLSKQTFVSVIYKKKVAETANQ
jgi:predicted Zn-dependent peptidase